MAKAKYSHNLIQCFFGKNTELNQLSPETLKASALGCPLASRILFPSWTGVYVGSGPERSQTHHRSRFLASVSTGAAYSPLVEASHLSRGKPQGIVGPSLAKYSLPRILASPPGLIYLVATGFRISQNACLEVGPRSLCRKAGADTFALLPSQHLYPVALSQLSPSPGATSDSPLFHL